MMKSSTSLIWFRNAVGAILASAAVFAVVISSITITNDGAQAQDPLLPGVPTGITLTPRDSGLLVGWNPPASGDIVVDYDARHKKNSQGEADWVVQENIPLDAMGTTISNLENGILYDVQVRANNSTGSSSWSAVMSAIPTASTAPAATPTPMPDYVSIELTSTSNGKGTIDQPLFVTSADGVKVDPTATPTEMPDVTPTEMPDVTPTQTPSDGVISVGDTLSVSAVPNTGYEIVRVDWKRFNSEHQNQNTTGVTDDEDEETDGFQATYMVSEADRDHYINADVLNRRVRSDGSYVEGTELTHRVAFHPIENADGTLGPSPALPTPPSNSIAGLTVELKDGDNPVRDGTLTVSATLSDALMDAGYSLKEARWFRMNADGTRTKHGETTTFTDGESTSDPLRITELGLTLYARVLLNVPDDHEGTTSGDTVPSGTVTAATVDHMVVTPAPDPGNGQSQALPQSASGPSVGNMLRVLVTQATPSEVISVGDTLSVSAVPNTGYEIVRVDWKRFNSEHQNQNTTGVTDDEDEETDGFQATYMVSEADRDHYINADVLNRRVRSDGSYVEGTELTHRVAFHPIENADGTLGPSPALPTPPSNSIAGLTVELKDGDNPVRDGTLTVSATLSDALMDAGYSLKEARWFRMNADGTRTKHGETTTFTDGESTSDPLRITELGLTLYARVLLNVPDDHEGTTSGDTVPSGTVTAATVTGEVNPGMPGTPTPDPTATMGDTLTATAMLTSSALPGHYIYQIRWFRVDAAGNETINSAATETGDTSTRSLTSDYQLTAADAGYMIMAKAVVRDADPIKPGGNASDITGVVSAVVLSISGQDPPTTGMTTTASAETYGGYTATIDWIDSDDNVVGTEAGYRPVSADIGKIVSARAMLSDSAGMPAPNLTRIVEVGTVVAVTPTATPGPKYGDGGRISKLAPSATNLKLRPGDKVVLSVKVYGVQNVGDDSLGAGVLFDWSDDAGQLAREEGLTTYTYTAPGTPGSYTVTARVAGTVNEGVEDITDCAPSDPSVGCSAMFDIRVVRPFGIPSDDTPEVNPDGDIPEILTDAQGNQYEVFTPEEGGAFNGDGFTITAKRGDVPNGEIIGVRMEDSGAASNAGMIHQRYTLGGNAYEISLVDASGAAISDYELDSAAEVCLPLHASLRSSISNVAMVVLKSDGTLLITSGGVRLVGSDLSVCGHLSELPATVAIGSAGAPDPLPTATPTPLPTATPVAPDTGGTAPSSNLALWILILGTSAVTLGTFLAMGRRGRQSKANAR